MSWPADQLTTLATAGRLYSSVILYGGEAARRLDLAHEIGRALLCEREAEARPCGECKHCRRIDRKNFHPDFTLLRRDKGRRDIPVDQVRPLVRTAQVSPFEARGQVFVIDEAETMNPFGAEALLKTLEEPADTTPRNFLLLTPSASELLPTLCSRSLAVYLGAGDASSAGTDEDLLSDLVDLWRQRPGDDAFAMWVSALAERLLAGGGFDDIRSRQGWTRIASAMTEAAGALDDRRDRAAALALAADLLDAHRLRLRSIQPRRIIEGLAARRLRRDRPETAFESSVNVLIGPP